MRRLGPMMLSLGVIVCAAAGGPLLRAQQEGHAHDHHDHHHAQHDHAQHDHEHRDHAQHDQHEDREVLYWYDPMHPEHRFDAPGRSPFMDMDLVPRYADEVDPGTVHISAGVAQRMNIRTAVARREALPREISTVGAIDYDQSRVHHLHTRVEGWIEAVDVHAVGDRVEAGQRLFTIYSPALVNAQEELVHAVERGEPRMIEAAREKLRALGVQSELLEVVERTGSVQRTVPWRARHDGVITELAIRHGMFVAPGAVLLETVDLSGLWLSAEVFPGDVAKLAPELPVEVRLANVPGEVFDARVGYIYPELQPVTRTVRVRIPLQNTAGAFRPGMWAAVRILAEPTDPVLAIPREALIRTGREHRVVIREDAERFRVLEVEPGLESGALVEIRSGLDAGAEVVVSGQFLIDSEASFGAGFGRLGGAHQH